MLIPMVVLGSGWVLAAAGHAGALATSAWTMSRLPRPLDRAANDGYALQSAARRRP